jgi:predicted transcriptional regulator
MFDDTQELAENKLLLLYIINKINIPISNAYITEIVLENNLLNYFHLQQYLSELVASEFLIQDKQNKKQIIPSVDFIRGEFL